MADKFERIREYFLKYFEIDDEDERARFLEGIRESDPEIAPDLERLLEAQRAEPSFLELSTEETPASGADSASVAAGTMIGHYRILRRIGEGGFGEVYLAERLEPILLRVAIKIIKPGMDSKQVIGRFTAERQALALMDHPNIAKILDAGTTQQGAPFFVMELVDGLPVHEFCNRNKVSTDERLRLFIQILQAVHHAHQKGIIHRDIKPNNVLVTLRDGKPDPKIIDFGIAKALDQKLTDITVFTELRQFLGTPAYMSPEQAEFSGLDVDTRSDIYSLGVLLYELIIGRPPFENKELQRIGLEAMLRHIREVDPPRPSTRLTSFERNELDTVASSQGTDPKRLTAQLRNDLDWILLKALEKDRRRRYDSASAFADDIQRRLNKEPVLAVAPSRLYKFTKLVARHRVAVGLGAMFVLSLVTLTLWALRSSADARVAEDKAKAAYEAAYLNQYVSDIRLAKSFIDKGDLANARESLDRYRPEHLDPNVSDPRDFVWGYLQNRARDDGPKIVKLDASPGAYAHSPMQNELAVSQSGEMLVFDTETLEVKQRIELELQVYRYGLDYSHDGRFLTAFRALWWRSQSNDNNLLKSSRRTWERSGEHLTPSDRFEKYPHGVLAFSPIAPIVAILSADSRILVYDYDRDVELLNDEAYWDEKYPPAICFSPDGERIAYTASLDAIATRTLDWGRPTTILPTNTRLAQGDYSLCFSPSSDRLFLYGYYYDTVLWEFPEPTENRTEIPIKLNSIAFTSDASRAVTTEALELRPSIRDTRDFSITDHLIGHSKQPGFAIYLKDDTAIVTGAGDQTLRVWEPETDESKTLEGVRTAGLDGLSFGQTSDRVFLRRGTQYLTRNPSRYIVEREPAVVASIASRDVQPILEPPRAPQAESELIGIQRERLWFAAYPDGLEEFQVRNIRVRDLVAYDQDGVELESVRLPHELRATSRIAFHPTAPQAALGTVDGSLLVIDLNSGQTIQQISPHELPTLDARYSPRTGRWLASTEGNGLYALPVTIQHSNRICLTDLNGAIPRTSLIENPDNVYVTRFSPDESILAAGGSSALITLWDVKTRHRIGELQVPLGVVAGYSIADLEFSPDGAIVAAPSRQTISFWNVKTQRLLMTLEFDEFVHAVEFSPDGSVLAYCWGPRWAPDKVSFLTVD